MNMLLPFGEYTAPPTAAAAAAAVESWELERLLIHIASAQQQQERRHVGRARPHFWPGGLLGVEDSGREAIRARFNAGEGRRGGREAAAVSGGSQSSVDGVALAPHGRRATAPVALPSSWPPAGGLGSSVEREAHVEGGGSIKNASQAIRNRLASFKFR
jgi:hypothetical protein